MPQTFSKFLIMEKVMFKTRLSVVTTLIVGITTPVSGQNSNVYPEAIFGVNLGAKIEMMNVARSYVYPEGLQGKPIGPSTPVSPFRKLGRYHRASGAIGYSILRWCWKRVEQEPDTSPANLPGLLATSSTIAHENVHCVQGDKMLPRRSYDDTPKTALTREDLGLPSTASQQELDDAKALYCGERELSRERGMETALRELMAYYYSLINYAENLETVVPPALASMSDIEREDLQDDLEEEVERIDRAVQRRDRDRARAHSRASAAISNASSNASWDVWGSPDALQGLVDHWNDRCSH